VSLLLQPSIFVSLSVVCMNHFHTHIYIEGGGVLCQTHPLILSLIFSMHSYMEEEPCRFVLMVDGSRQVHLCALTVDDGYKWIKVNKLV